LTRRSASDTVPSTNEPSATDDVELGQGDIGATDPRQVPQTRGMAVEFAGPKAKEGHSMPAESPDDTPRHRAAALTPRPLRLLLVGRIKPGAEPALRQVQARFPLEAAAEAGIDAFEAFIGSGQYAVELEIGAQDVQRVLATFFNDPRIREFRTSLEPIVEGLPGADYRFGAAYRSHDETERASGQTVYNTGDLHFAASMYRWRAGQPPQTGAVPYGHGALNSSA
jgi:hypothetical protein